MDVFLCGKGHTRGTENCRCTNECEFPCWQRIGLTDQMCVTCGCHQPERGDDGER